MGDSVEEIIQIHIGQAGVQIANACWELYCIEHGIPADGCMQKIPEDESFKAYFSVGNNLRAVPRVIMVDSEPTVIDEIRKGPYRNLFAPTSLITGKEDCGSNFARGYNTIGSEMIECVMDHIRKAAENCRNLRGFLIFRAIGGGTGSGIGNRVLENIYKTYGKIPRLEFIIFPSPSLSPLVAEPYNAILSTHKALDICECSFIMDNEALYRICATNLDVNSPTYTNLNRIIAQVISGFTASQRFSGGATLNFGDFQTNLVPYPRVHFPLVSFSPLTSTAKAEYGKPSTSQITNQCFDPSFQLTQCNPSKGKCMACILLYRGDVRPGDVNSSIIQLKKNNTTRFVDWSPTGFKISITSKIGQAVPGGDLGETNRSLVALTNNTAIQTAWCRLTFKFNQLMSRRAFFHHFISEGLEESTLKDAADNVCALLREYQKVDGENRLSLK